MGRRRSIKSTVFSTGSPLHVEGWAIVVANAVMHKAVILSKEITSRISITTNPNRSSKTPLLSFVTTSKSTRKQENHQGILTHFNPLPESLYIPVETSSPNLPTNATYQSGQHKPQAKQYKPQRETPLEEIQQVKANMYTKNLSDQNSVCCLIFNHVCRTRCQQKQ